MKSTSPECIDRSDEALADLAAIEKEVRRRRALQCQSSHHEWRREKGSGKTVCITCGIPYSTFQRDATVCKHGMHVCDLSEIQNENFSCVVCGFEIKDGMMRSVEMPDDGRSNGYVRVKVW